MWNGPNSGQGIPYNPYNVTPVPNYNPMPQQSSQIIFDLVQGDDGARNYPMAPNTKAILMDMNNCLMWSKIADAFGKVDMHKFKFNEIPFGTQLQEDATKATQEEFKQMNDRLTRIEEMLKEHINV